MTPQDIRLVVSAVLGIALVIVLILRGRLHAFIALLCGAFTVGILAGLPLADTAQAVQKGVADILGGTGLIVALGLSLGAMLALSNGASSLARTALRLTGPAGAPWGSLFAAMLIGLPLFFETGLVLLLPIVAAAAAALPEGKNSEDAKLRVILSALGGLSVVHALVPPHPGPLLAVNALGANLGRTMIYGLLIAVPTGLLAGPCLSFLTARKVAFAPLTLEPVDVDAPAPPNASSLAVVLLPVVLIAAGEARSFVPASLAPAFGWLAWASNPVIALLLANLVALPLLFGRKLFDAEVQTPVWAEAMKPAGAVLLAIGAGGALKQVLVSAGLSTLLAKLAAAHAISPLVLSWLVAVCIRLATGSATVATITTVGVVSGMVAASGVSPEWAVLAIGAGSLFFSHVNDPGFWLVKSYVGFSTGAAFRTWSVMETAVSVLGLGFVLLGSQVLR